MNFRDLRNTNRDDFSLRCRAIQPKIRMLVFFEGLTIIINLLIKLKYNCPIICMHMN